MKSVRTSDWPYILRRVALSVTALLAALLVTPALGIGDRLLSLIQRKPTPLDVQAPAWSPDGRKIAFASERDGNSEIDLMNADGSGQWNLTRNLAYDGDPAWSPGGQKITFVSNRDGRYEVYVMNADGSGQRRLT